MDTLVDLRTKLSDPTKFGPLMWYLIHNMSLQLDQDTFIRVLPIIIELIPCPNCRNHAKEYLSTNSLDLYKDIHNEDNGELVGMFKWTWKFHNDVNIRLNKPLVDFDVAYKMYNHNDRKDKDELVEACESLCGLSP